MILAINNKGKAELAFQDTTEAGVWSKLPTRDIEQAIKRGETLYGYKYEEVDEAPGVPLWGELGESERATDPTYAVKLLTSVDADGCVYDPYKSEMLTPEQLYAKHFEGLTVREIFDALMKAVTKKHQILDYVEAQKEEIQKLLISQAPTNARGEECVYVPLEEAVPVIEQMRLELGIEGKVVQEAWEEEGYIGKFDGKCYFAVKELNKEWSFEEWRGGREASMSTPPEEPYKDPHPHE